MLKLNAIEVIRPKIALNSPLDFIRLVESNSCSCFGSIQYRGLLNELGFTPDALRQALKLKSMTSQINVVIHAFGIMTVLPYILDDSEKIEMLSLGAGNTGKDYDLITNKRVAEFKFISWKGGSESIRQNRLFKDFVSLLWEGSSRRKQLYLLGLEKAVGFLSGNRSMNSVLSKDDRFKQEFFNKFNGKRYDTVGDFYRAYSSRVELVDVLGLHQDLKNIFA